MACLPPAACFVGGDHGLGTGRTSGVVVSRTTSSTDSGDTVDSLCVEDSWTAVPAPEAEEPVEAPVRVRAHIPAPKVIMSTVRPRTGSAWSPGPVSRAREGGIGSRNWHRP